MAVTNRHVHAVFGKLPDGSRLPTPAAHIVAQSLHTCMPELSPAAARVCAQHLHHVARHRPDKGSADALKDMSHDLGLKLRPYHGPAGMHAAVDGNFPLSALLAESRRIAAAEKKAKSAHKEADYARGGIEEVLREAIEHHGKEPTKKELEEIHNDLARMEAAQGGSMFGQVTRSVMREVEAAKKAHPIRYAIMRKILGGAREGGAAEGGSMVGLFLAAQAAKYLLKKRKGGAREGGALLGGAREGGALLGGALLTSSCEGGAYIGGAKYGKPHEGIGFAEEDVEYALKKHHGKMTAAEKKQMVRDIEKYGIGEPRSKGGKAAASKSKIRKGTLYDAFR